jgi:hypothetical protein
MRKEWTILLIPVITDEHDHLLMNSTLQSDKNVGRWGADVHLGTKIGRATVIKFHFSTGGLTSI